MARRKNTKFIDPRYFMDEKTEIVKEDVSKVVSEAHEDHLAGIRNKIGNLGTEIKNLKKTDGFIDGDPEITDHVDSLRDKLSALESELEGFETGKAHQPGPKLGPHARRSRGASQLSSPWDS